MSELFMFEENKSSGKKKKAAYPPPVFVLSFSNGLANAQNLAQMQLAVGVQCLYVCGM